MALCIVFACGNARADEAAAASPAAETSAGPSAEQVEFFESRVRPLLAQHCQECHGSSEPEAGLNLTTRSSLLHGSAAGSIVAVGDPDQSRLIEVIRYQGDVQMPPEKKLADTEVAILVEWVRQGLPWPTESASPASDAAGSPAATDAAALATDPYAAVRASHWAFRPIVANAPPALTTGFAAANEVDNYVLAALSGKGLPPSPPADRQTLIRRVTFDLTGLPPTPEEIDAFVNDPAPDAWAKVVDRLLASPAYGQRWARHWLDVARYADSKGYVFTSDPRYYHAYGYRDFVVKALNDDMPFDEFLQRQIAADLLPTSADPRTWTAMGFLTLGMRFMNNQHDIFDDRIDVVTRGVMGLTVTCARCHDHKFDPIPTADYYSLYGVFASSPEPGEPTLAGTPEENAAYSAHQEVVRAAEKLAADFLAAAAQELGADVKPEEAEKMLDAAKAEELKALRKAVEETKAQGPPEPPRAMALTDAPTPHAPRVFLRGNPGRPGPEVPRQFLAVLSPDRQPFQQGSGRLELAQRLTAPDNPLTARVMVNRVWLHHFGQGLVGTPSDFGVRTEPPTHPELLDFLAARFQQEGWSLKTLHRSILLSNTYRQSSADRADAAAVDPENRLVWRMNRQRLEFEPFRDALLAVAGRLDVSLEGKPVQLFEAPFPARRSIYGFVNRNDLPGTLRVFDFPTPDVSNPERARTTVPQQALFAMNAPFVQEQAKHLATRADLPGEEQRVERIRRMYRVVLGRDADDEEVALGSSYLDAAAAEPATELTPWARYAQVLLMSNEFAFVD